MRLNESFCNTRQVLADNGIDDASLEGELLLRQTLRIDRVQFYQNLEQDITMEQQDILRRLLQRRLRGEPLAYIRSHCEFYGLDFYVNNNVLIPRPETEYLLEITLNLVRKHSRLLIADVGTGCGIIAISLALNLPQVNIYAIDISAPALRVARLNCFRHGVTDKIKLFNGNMLDPLPQPVNFIIANLPYVRKSELDKHSFEPQLALDGGIDGLKNIRRLCHQVSDKLLPGGCLLMEIGKGQKEAVTSLLNNLFPTADIEVMPDLSGIDRVISMTLPQEK
ncbi:MAG: peptide chain release factor N(5)-glutamine methyltransferase [Dehalococcoidia bacterium]|nr:MAG: peptide chain release factor N(5)-glutamine methyltransferase [Dehalococcoidia bacterium]